MTSPDLCGFISSYFPGFADFRIQAGKSQNTQKSLLPYFSQMSGGYPRAPHPSPLFLAHY